MISVTLRTSPNITVFFVSSSPPGECAGAMSANLMEANSGGKFAILGVGANNKGDHLPGGG